MKAVIKNNQKEYRLKAGLLRKNIANKLWFKCWDRICKSERGQTLPSVQNLFALAQLYRVNPSQIYPELRTTCNESI